MQLCLLLRMETHTVQKLLCLLCIVEMLHNTTDEPFKHDEMNMLTVQLVILVLD